MIIGHLPAGYIVSRLLVRHAESIGVSAKGFISASVIGAVAPDLDMFYFHLVDDRQHHHHTYFTHYPVVWFALLTASLAWLFIASKKNYAACAAVFSLNGFVHLILDTIVGDIWWFAPLSNEPFAFFTVPALYKPWWLNFLLHWSFAFEIAVIGWAVYLWRKSCHHKRT